MVVSTHARRGVMRGLLGSVSSALIRRGTTGVLIVPRVVTLGTIDLTSEFSGS